MTTPKKARIGRRTFIKGAVSGAATLLAQNTTAQQSIPGRETEAKDIPLLEGGAGVYTR